ncbi:MAG: hypothetical protein IPO22_22565 [Anaerolineales bacterium]|nr:hypothetical protein [Anaerolineales bacterium]
MKRIDMRIVFGIMLILGGALALLDTFGYLKNASDIFWGGVFIVAGWHFLLCFSMEIGGRHFQVLHLLLLAQ